MTFLGTRGRDRKAWKYRLAGLLNRRPGTCWTSLVCWAEYGQSQLGDCQIDQYCRSDVARNGRCYCGKLGGFEPGPSSEAGAPEPRKAAGA